MRHGKAYWSRSNIAEALKLHDQGKTNGEIGELLGFSSHQVAGKLSSVKKEKNQTNDNMQAMFSGKKGKNKSTAASATQKKKIKTFSDSFDGIGIDGNESDCTTPHIAIVPSPFPIVVQRNKETRTKFATILIPRIKSDEPPSLKRIGANIAHVVFHTTKMRKDLRDMMIKHTGTKVKCFKDEGVEFQDKEFSIKSAVSFVLSSQPDTLAFEIDFGEPYIRSTLSFAALDDNFLVVTASFNDGTTTAELEVIQLA